MISENILEMFKSHQSDPSFGILITDIEQKEECNQESIIFTVYQVNKSIEEIATGNVYEKKLHIISELNLDNDNLYKTKLIGYLSGEKLVQTIESPNEILSHDIEVLDTKLQKEIEIEFNKNYKETPKIIVNTDTNTKKLYKDYSTDFIKNVDDLFCFKIKFKNLKTRKSYPNIGIIIIGDKIDEETETNTDNSE